MSALPSVPDQNHFPVNDGQVSLGRHLDGRKLQIGNLFVTLPVAFIAVDATFCGQSWPGRYRSAPFFGGQPP
jgi:hypothetical protein